MKVQIDRVGLEGVQEALAVLKDHVPSVPDRNCACHVSPPCHNCVERTSIEYDIEMLASAEKIIAAALAAQEPAQAVEPEPVAQYIGESSEGSIVQLWEDIKKGTRLYTHPAPAKPLSDEQFTEIAHRTASRYTHRTEPQFVAYTFLPHTLKDFVRKIEAAHGIKETS